MMFYVRHWIVSYNQQKQRQLEMQAQTQMFHLNSSQKQILQSIHRKSQMIYYNEENSGDLL